MTPKQTIEISVRQNLITQKRVVTLHVVVALVIVITVVAVVVAMPTFDEILKMLAKYFFGHFSFLNYEATFSLE